MDARDVFTTRGVRRTLVSEPSAVSCGGLRREQICSRSIVASRASVVPAPPRFNEQLSSVQQWPSCRDPAQACPAQLIRMSDVEELCDTDFVQEVSSACLALSLSACSRGCCICARRDMMQHRRKQRRPERAGQQLLETMPVLVLCSGLAARFAAVCAHDFRAPWAKKGLATPARAQDDDTEDEEELQNLISAQYSQFAQEQAVRQEALRASRPWSAPPLMSPRPDTQRARKAEAEAEAASGAKKGERGALLPAVPRPSRGSDRGMIAMRTDR